MKILFDCQVPAPLAHGGAQIQIERTMEVLAARDVEVEHMRWWDVNQKGDIVHFTGRADPSMIRFAHVKGMKYVMTDLLTGQGSRKKWQLTLQGKLEKLLRLAVPATLLASFRWDAYQLADTVIVGTEWEADVARMLFAPPRGKLRVIPNGVEEVFFAAAGNKAPKGEALVCTATITPRKRVVELAEAAVAAQTPVIFLGAPYGKNDPYYKRFEEIARDAPVIVRYGGAIADRGELARIYSEARGFVLLSTMESRSLSSEEAAAAGCPLLLSDLPWARSVFGDNANYCPPHAATTETARQLKMFYDRAPAIPAPPAPCRWDDVADELIKLYRSL
jgi:glycosyltransferase involved in cell wall biosynthesis